MSAARVGMVIGLEGEGRLAEAAVERARADEDRFVASEHFATAADLEEGVAPG